MTQLEIDTALRELQTSITTHGLCYFPGDGLESSKQVAQLCASTGGHEYSDKVPKVTRPDNPSNRSVKAFISFPYKDHCDITTNDTEKREHHIRNSRRTRIQNNKILPGVHQIYIGNLPKESIEKIAKQQPLNSPIWFFGKPEKHCRVLPNLQSTEHGRLSIGSTSYNKIDRAFIPAYDQPTLHYFDRRTGKFVNTGVDKIAIPHRNQQNLSVAGGASIQHHMGQSTGAASSPVPIQPPPPTPFGDFLTTTAIADLTPYSYSQGAGAAGSGQGITSEDWADVSDALQEKHPGQPRFPGRGI